MPKLSTSKLTDTRVKALEAAVSEKGEAIPATYWDSELRGFGVQVLPSGGKTFYFRFKSPVTKKWRWYRLGRYTGPKSLASARTRATEVQLGLDKGLDPQVEDQKASEIPTMKKLVADFLAEHYKKKAASTEAAATALLDGIVVKEWGDLQPGHITRPMVQALFKKVGEGWRPGATEKAEPTPIQANRLLAYLSKLFNWSEKNDYQPLNTNPCRHIEKNPENKRQRFLSGEELQALGQVLKVEAEAGRIHEAGVLRLLILTGARLREVMHLRWNQVDMEAGTITLREHKTAGKVGTKVLPLNDQALEVLKGLSKVKLSGFVFPGADTRKPMASIQRFWERVRVEAKIPDVHLHDLRHTFGAAAVGEGLSLRVAGALLGHTQAQTTQRYAHASLEVEREATKKVGAKLGRLLG